MHTVNDRVLTPALGGGARISGCGNGSKIGHQVGHPKLIIIRRQYSGPTCAAILQRSSAPGPTPCGERVHGAQHSAPSPFCVRLAQQVSSAAQPTADGTVECRSLMRSLRALRLRCPPDCSMMTSRIIAVLLAVGVVGGAGSAFKGSLSRTLIGHTGQVWSLVTLPDGRLASGSNDGTVKLWDVATGSCSATLRGHTGEVSSLAVLPDGRLASGSYDRTVKLWDVATESCSATLSGPDPNLWWLVTSLAGIVAGTHDDSLDGHTSGVASLAVLPGGHLASADPSKVKLWDVAAGSCIGTLHTKLVHATSLVVLRDGRLAIGWFERVTLCDLATGSCNTTIAGHDDSVYALAVLPDGRLASGSKDKTIKLWDVATGSCVATLSGHTGTVYALAVLPDGRLASGSEDKTIKLWDLSTWSCVSTLSWHASPVYALVVLPDGRLASGSGDKTVKLWE